VDRIPDDSTELLQLTDEPASELRGARNNDNALWATHTHTEVIPHASSPWQLPPSSSVSAARSSQNACAPHVRV